MPVLLAAAALVVVLVRAIAGTWGGARPWQPRRLAWPAFVATVGAPLAWVEWAPLTTFAARAGMTQTVFNVCVLVLPLVGVAALCAATPELDRTPRARPAAVATAFATGLSFQVLGAAAFALIHGTPFPMPSLPALAPLCAISLSAIVEELVLRGVLQGLLDAAALDKAFHVTAIVLMNLLFGLAHQQPLTSRLVIAIVGCLLAIARARAGLAAAVAAHLAYDLAFVVLLP